MLMIKMSPGKIIFPSLKSSQRTKWRSPQSTKLRIQKTLKLQHWPRQCAKAAGEQVFKFEDVLDSADADFFFVRR